MELHLLPFLPILTGSSSRGFEESLWMKQSGNFAGFHSQGRGTSGLVPRDESIVLAGWKPSTTIAPCAKSL
jgi:hypothetical protein